MGSWQYLSYTFFEFFVQTVFIFKEVKCCSKTCLKTVKRQSQGIVMLRRARNLSWSRLIPSTASTSFRPNTLGSLPSKFHAVVWWGPLKLPMPILLPACGPQWLGPQNYVNAPRSCALKRDWSNAVLGQYRPPSHPYVLRFQAEDTFPAWEGECTVFHFNNFIVTSGRLGIAAKYSKHPDVCSSSPSVILIDQENATRYRTVSGVKNKMNSCMNMFYDNDNDNEFA